MPNHECNGRSHDFINAVLHETPGGQRFTLDSPILPSVWMAYAMAPCEQQDLIITLNADKSAGKATEELRIMLMDRLRKNAPKWGPLAQREKARPRMTYIPGQIAARLYFDELMRIVLPLTPWWQKNFAALQALAKKKRFRELKMDFTGFPQPNDELEGYLISALMLMRQGIGGQVHDEDTLNNRKMFVRQLPVDLVWLVRIAGLIAHCAQKRTDLFGPRDELSESLEKDFKYRTFDREGNTIDPHIHDYGERSSNPKQWDSDPRIKQQREDAEAARKEIACRFTQLYTGWSPKNEQPDKEKYFLFQVTLNRKVELAGVDSSMTVKADAGRRLFEVSCEKIRWAVIDSGIDREHPAFKDTSLKHEQEVLRQPEKEKGESSSKRAGVSLEDLATRVDHVYDFTDLRDLLDPDVLAGSSDETKKRRERLVKRLTRRMSARPDLKKKDETKTPLDMAEEYLEELKNRIKKGHEIDWESLEPLIEDTNPDVPKNDHGTHVAGVLAADWIDDDDDYDDMPLAQRPRQMVGMCPDIRLIDVRVFRERGDTEEFELLAAVQFLRWLNSRAGYMTVHGANLSLSLVHEVRRFACGQTPICVECNEAVALGMVMVAAAGNRGYESANVQRVGSRRGFRAISITDPGNAEHVITVGATHRKRPHEYGVSYFSSRGPTGDGRRKPDLVAPGEKIHGPTPNEGAEYKDGTSMAAPHVSGAAAMLMARHSELIGQPGHIKKILCSTATDLGRDKYFQGCGLVDILRALQSV